jgi:hypothetical protein
MLPNFAFAVGLYRSTFSIMAKVKTSVNVCGIELNAYLCTR